MAVNEVLSQPMEWDDYIEDDGQPFVVLDEGDYNFVVENFERGRYQGGGKIAACNKAVLTLRVETPDGRTANVVTILLLTKSLEWKVSAFFRSIHQKQTGERVQMKWDKIVGCQGRAHFAPRSWIGTDGKEHESNNVEYYIDYDPKYFEDAEGFIDQKVTSEDDLPF